MEYTIPKYWIYQVWNSTGQYLGVLQDVTSEFILVQDVNTLGPSSITIKVAQTGDTARLPVKALMSEDGKLITTEDGKVITTEGEPTNFGVTNAKIKNGNIIKITEYSNYHPNGLLVFTGQVEKWNVRLGTKDDMSILVKPLSTDMTDHILKIGEGLAKTQSTQGASLDVYNNIKFSYLYRFNVTEVKNLSSIALMLSAQSATPTTFTVAIFNLGPDVTFDSIPTMDNIANAVATATIPVSSTSALEYKATFPLPIQLNPASYYGIRITATGGSGTGGRVYYSYGNVDNNGFLVRNPDDGSGWTFGTNPSDAANTYGYYGDFYYKFYHIPPFTKQVATNFDPGQVMRTAMNYYMSESGVLTYDNTTVALTGIVVPSYTFSLNTMHDGVKTMLDYAPQGFYFTVDPGLNIFTFKQLSSTPDHILIFGRHIEELDFSGSIESVKNAAYMTGGEVGGVNVLRYDEDVTSKNNYGVRLDRITDVKVTNTGTADSRIDTHLSKRKDEEYETTATIIDGMEDITIYKPGHTVGIRGTGSDLVDSLVLPIVRIERMFGAVKLYLGALPLREQDLINDSREQILAIQTVANPNEPS